MIKIIRHTTFVVVALCVLGHSVGPVHSADARARVRHILSGAFEGKNILPWLERLDEGERAAVRELARGEALDGRKETAIVRENAVRAIGLLKDAQGLDIVLALTRDKDSGLRRAALYSLGRLASPAALQELRGQLSDAHHDPQAAFIIRALADGGDASDIPRLRVFREADRRTYIGREVDKAEGKIQARLGGK